MLPVTGPQNESTYNRKRRLSSLDVLRGLTVFMMIFVDQIGATWPIIDHCPWNGIHLADFVMPYFNFMIGLGVSFSMKKFIKNNNKLLGFRKASVRFLKLFFIGMFTQGGIDIANYNMKYIRIMGILQRVAFCYYFIAIIELIFVKQIDIDSNSVTATAINNQLYPASKSIGIPDPIQQASNSRSKSLLAMDDDNDNNRNNNPIANNNNVIHDNPFKHQLFRSFINLFLWFKYHWIVCIFMLILWISIMYGVHVPNQYGSICGYGVLSPACNAQGYIDKHILTVNHMYFPENGGEYNPNDLYSNDVTFQRLSDCSSCSPGKCLKNETIAPEWCFKAAFDPEGLISSITCVLSPVFGIHCGHLFQYYKSDKIRMLHLTILGLFEIIIGLILHFSSLSKLNTDLYSPSYLILTSGSATLTLMILYYIMDIRIFLYRNICKQRKLSQLEYHDIEQDGSSDYISSLYKRFWYFIDLLIFYPLECIGRNALGIYILAESGIINWFFEIFYWGKYDNSFANIFWPTGYYWGPTDENAAKEWRYSIEIMIWVLSYCIFWSLCAIYFHRNKMYWVV